MRTAYLLVLRRPTLRLLSSTLPLPHTHSPPPHTAAFRCCVFSASHNKMLEKIFFTYKKWRIFISAQLFRQGSDKVNPSIVFPSIIFLFQEFLVKKIYSGTWTFLMYRKPFAWLESLKPRFEVFFRWLWSNFFLWMHGRKFCYESSRHYPPSGNNTKQHKWTDVFDRLCIKLLSNLYLSLVFITWLKLRTEFLSSFQI